MIEDLKKQSEQYVQEHTDRIVSGMYNRKEIITKVSTCDAPNWDRQLHACSLVLHVN
jgi:hypothetical protein